MGIPRRVIANVLWYYTVRVTEMEDDFPSTVDTTGTVEVGGTATGEIEYENDWDWFAVELAAGQGYHIDLKGRSTNDGTLYSPYLRGIYDAEGNQIPGTVDRGAGSGKNSRVHFTAETDGTYYIAAASAYNTSLGTYEVRVWEDDFSSDSRGTTGTVEVGGSATGEIQRAGDYDCFAVELEAGKTYQIDMGGVQSGVGTLWWPHLSAVYGADGHYNSVPDPIIIVGGIIDGVEVDGEDEQAFLTPEEDGTYYLVVRDWGASRTGTYTVRVTEIEDDFPATVHTTGTVEVGGTATGEAQYEGDHDWFAVELTAGETYKVQLMGWGRGGDNGTLLSTSIHGIHDANGRLISNTTDNGSGPFFTPQVLFTPDQDGTYYVAAGSILQGIRDEEVGTYTLIVSVDDFRGGTDTTGTVAVGGSVIGEIETQADEDWFAVTLEAGKTYQIDLEGSATDAGTLANPFLLTMRVTDGDYVRYANGRVNWNTSDFDSGEGLNSRVTFTPDETGTYYINAASGGWHGSPDSHGRSLGTYTLSVEESVPPVEELVDAI